ncbi:MAG TPA: hypothetical protein VFP89_04865 [Propionibacteriaceae bacterium]|nr:hypothetical protein [Propionibacteriaceae bacterium]
MTPRALRNPDAWCHFLNERAVGDVRDWFDYSGDLWTENRRLRGSWAWSHSWSELW